MEFLFKGTRGFVAELSLALIALSFLYAHGAGFLQKALSLGGFEKSEVRVWFQLHRKITALIERYHLDFALSWRRFGSGRSSYRRLLFSTRISPRCFCRTGSSGWQRHGLVALVFLSVE